jgi:hypothetical protein
MIDINQMRFKVALGREAHQLAQQFHRQQRYAKRAQQVYLNTLAIYAVQYYLNCFGLSTDFPHPKKSELMMRSLSSSACLTIKDRGKVECCPVLPDENFCTIPFDARGNRLAYIAVGLNAELSEASLLGVLPAREFEKWRNVVPRALRDRTQISLGHFQPLENLFEALEPQPTVLSNWWQNALEEGWKTFEELFPTPPPILAFRSSATTAPPPEPPQNLMKLGHIVELKPGITIALCIGLEKTELIGMEISVEIYPYGDDPVLPAALKLQVLDERGEDFLQAKTKGVEEEFTFEFRGEPGDRFSVQLDWQDERIIRLFLV